MLVIDMAVMPMIIAVQLMLGRALCRRRLKLAWHQSHRKPTASHFTTSHKCAETSCVGKPTPGPRSPEPRTGCPRIFTPGTDSRSPATPAISFCIAASRAASIVSRATVIQLKRGLHCSHSSSCRLQQLQLLRQVLQCR